MKLHNSALIFFVKSKISWNQNVKTASTGSSITPIKYFAFPLIEENIPISRNTKWQNYIKTQLIETGLADHAVICDQNGMIWAKSEDMNVDVEELKILIINHNNGKLLNGNSILINGVRYTCSSGSSRHVSSNTVCTTYV